ncbi:MAG: cobalamin biosynthesis protein CbiM [Firmicutes bacterium HGW-Firmicutes-1]|nr:MAG: cobalamin biosynthesis protein CbiM [Firmicutes bacterium HGW-Firmicutes-1]
MKNKKFALGLLFLILLFQAKPVYAMHIAEGFLPLKWCIFWFACSIPIVTLGIYKLTKRIQKNPEQKMLVGVSGAFTFVLSALKMPSVTGSSSHPTGVALGAILFGPMTMSVLGTIVLLFQALLLAHGGLTTLGANVFAMAIVGPVTAYWLYWASIKLGLNRSIAVFFATVICNIFIYATTSFQLALAFPGDSFAASSLKFLTVFAVTQIPLAIIEGLLTVMIFNFLEKHESTELEKMLIAIKE